MQFELCAVEIADSKAFVRGFFNNVASHGKEIKLQLRGKFVSILEKQTNGRWLRSHAIINSGLPDD